MPYWVAQFAGAICAALFLQAMFTHVSAGGNYPISTPGGDWRSLVMKIVLTAILVSVIVSRHHERALLGRSKRAVLREQEDGLPVLGPAICMADAEMPAMSGSRPSTIRTGGGPRWP